VGILARATTSNKENRPLIDSHSEKPAPSTTARQSAAGEPVVTVILSHED
jgi:hypothetical protein